MNNIQDLLALYGEDFLNESYRIILGRKADSQGLKHYLSMLNIGTSKLEMLLQLSRSKEAKKYNANFPGLANALSRHKLSKLPFFFWRAPKHEQIDYKLRILENKLYELANKKTSYSPSVTIESNQDAQNQINYLNQVIAERDNELSLIKNNNTLDLTWEQFQAQVLNLRENYKGIFIQQIIIDWSVPLYQRPQHIASALGRLGYLVIYKTANWEGCLDITDGYRQVAPNVWITSRWEVNDIKGAVHSIYSTASFHEVQNIPNYIKDGIIVYEYIDHIDPQISGEGESIKRLKALKKWAFTGGADIVVASAKKLHAEAVEMVGNDKVVLAQNGVDTRHYRNPIHNLTVLPDNLMAFRNKYQNIVGYFGAIAPWLWYEAINGLVKSRPDLGFIFIGPDYYEGVDKLPIAENVLYLGVVDYKILPAYAKQFDVCFIPFEPGEIAKTTSPLKLFEYFALEKPVVVTSDMAECVAFKEVFSGNSVAALNNAIDQAIAIKEDKAFKKRLAQLADENDWDERAKAMEKVFVAKKINTISSNISEVQKLIASCHHEDGLNEKYYEDVYSLEEELYWKPIPRWILDISENISSVIDVGAAYGTLLTYTAINKQAKTLHAVDPVGYMSESLKNKLNVTLHKVNFETQDIGIHNKFDLIIFTEIIEHLNFAPLATLAKLKNLMSPNSRLIISTPDAAEWGRVTKYYLNLSEIPVYSGQDYTWIDGHIWQYSKNELEDVILKAGFEVEKFDYSPGKGARHLCYLLKIAK